MNQQVIRSSTPQSTKFLRWFGWLALVCVGMFQVDCGPRGDDRELIVLPEGSPSEQTSQTDTANQRDAATEQSTAPDQTPRDHQPRDTKAPDQSPPEATQDAPRADQSSNVDQTQDDQNEPDFTPGDHMPGDQSTPDQATPARATAPDTPNTDRATPDHIGTPCRVNGTAGTCKRTTDCTGNNQSVPGHCPGAAGIQCCIPKQPPSSGCDPNARPQPNAGLKEAPGQGGCKPGMVKVSNFCIDQYEGSLLEVLPNGTTRPWSPYFNPGNTKVRAVSIKGAVPQGYINGIQAAKACKEAGKRLCTDTEWLRACQSANKYTYPYGNTRRPGVCHDARSKHPAVEYFKSSAQWVFGKIQHQCLNQLPMSLAKTGSYTGCVTVEKVYDMMGNLHEWTSNSTGIFRGGFYVDTYRNGPGCLYRTTAHTTHHWDYSTGFRCCSN